MKLQSQALAIRRKDMRKYKLSANTEQKKELYSVKAYILCVVVLHC